MEFKEFVKQRERMCNVHKICNNNCELYKIKSERITCLESCVDYDNIEEVEQIVERWAKEHPKYTRADKFKEHYKDRPWQKYNKDDSCKFEKCNMEIPCLKCKWWNEEVEK